VIYLKIFDFTIYTEEQIIKNKVKIIKNKFILLIIKSLKIKKNKVSSIKIIINKKKKLIAAILVKISGSLFNITVLNINVLLLPLFSFLSSCSLSFLPDLMRIFEIIKIIKNKNKATKTIIANAAKFEM
jgi:hypothetical protein